MIVKLKHFLPGLGLLASLNAQARTTPVFRDSKPPLGVRVNDLIKQLTLEEKAQQMLDQSPAIARLGIPAYSWWNEALGAARPASAVLMVK
ncbi:hypothetical protein A0257_05040 [Hymenobacter psoromatis]|nr:hypothetical protein A0257_05040 [Hymenobacter psoromatis]